MVAGFRYAFGYSIGAHLPRCKASDERAKATTSLYRRKAGLTSGLLSFVWVPASPASEPAQQVTPAPVSEDARQERHCAHRASGCYAPPTACPGRSCRSCRPAGRETCPLQVLWDPSAHRPYRHQTSPDTTQTHSHAYYASPTDSTASYPPYAHTPLPHPRHCQNTTHTVPTDPHRPQTTTSSQCLHDTCTPTPLPWATDTPPIPSVVTGSPGSS